MEVGLFFSGMMHKSMMTRSADLDLYQYSWGL